MTSDFWWLTGDQLVENWSAGVGHHEPLPDEFNEFAYRPSQEEPIFPHWWHSTAEDGEPSNAFKRYPLHFLETWRSRWNNRNVYRTLLLFPDLPEGQRALGPFLVDIDSQDWTNGWTEHLDEARDIAVRAADILMSKWNLREGSDFRVFFSGRKGFNIETRPSAAGIRGNLQQQIVASAKRLGELIGDLQLQEPASPSIDRIYGDRFGYRLKHPYIRLHNSWNKWASNGTSERVRLELSVEQLKAEAISSICSRAQPAS